MGDGFATGLREYEDFKEIYEKGRRDKETYAILSEAAENGDSEAIYYLAKWYEESPVKYGKKRNRILQTGNSWKCLVEVVDAYDRGYYCAPDKEKMEQYDERLAETCEHEMKRKFHRTYFTKGFREALKWVERYQEKYGDIDYRKDVTQAIMYICTIRNKIKYEKTEQTPEEIKEEIRMILEIEYPDDYFFGHRAWGDELQDLGGTVAAFAYLKKKRYKETFDVSWISNNIRTVANMAQVIAEEAEESVVEYMIVQLWKGIHEGEHKKRDKERAERVLNELLSEYKKKGTLVYMRLIRLAQEAGCVGADTEVAKMQEYLRDESMLTQALEVLRTSNYRSAIQELIRLADKGNAEACYHLGIEYEKGTKVPRDIDKARAYMKKAANEGYTEAERWVKEWTEQN